MTDRVCAVLVTRGDVDMAPIVESLPEAWEVVVWDNSKRPSDLFVYGRYAGIADTDAETIYVQDDDVIVEEPQALVEALAGRRDRVVCNMPDAWREQDFYDHHALVGFGAAFHRDLPAKAFVRFAATSNWSGDYAWFPPGGPHFLRECDVAFTTLVAREVVDIPYENLPYATSAYRMYRSRDHGARKRMLDLALQATERVAA